jgi:stearoyl-CoA desaturase (delta-9 desaturase)
MVRIRHWVGLHPAARARRVGEGQAHRPYYSIRRPKQAVDQQTLQAIVRCRYDVLARYGRSLLRTYREELGKLSRVAPQDAMELQTVKPWLDRDERLLREHQRARLAELLPKSHVLQTMFEMRHELAAVWGRSMATREQLVAQLRDWCRRAETSEITPLAEFAR